MVLVPAWCRCCGVQAHVHTNWCQMDLASNGVDPKLGANLVLCTLCTPSGTYPMAWPALRRTGSLTAQGQGSKGWRRSVGERRAANRARGQAGGGGWRCSRRPPTLAPSPPPAPRHIIAIKPPASLAVTLLAAGATVRRGWRRSTLAATLPTATNVFTGGLSAI